MGRILAIDYGEKRTGLAVTDSLQIVASPLKGLQTNNLEEFLQSYIESEDVEQIVIGMPEDEHGRTLHITEKIEKFSQNLKEKYPTMTISFVVENFSSKEAQQLMIQSNRKKKFRQQKENLDMFSALVILRRHLGHE